MIFNNERYPILKYFKYRMFGSKIKQNLGHNFCKLSYYYNLKHTKIFNASVRIISRKQFSGLYFN